MNNLRIMSYVGIITTGWDILSHFKSEMAFLSGSSCELNIIKALYIATRYTPFIIYSGCIIFASKIQNHIPHTPTRLCQFFALFAAISCQWMASLVVTNLMLRVYALYNRSPYVIVTLVFLLVCKILVPLLVWEKAIHHPQQQFSPTCVPLFKQTLFSTMYSLTESLTLGIPVFLILRRSSKLSSVIREGAVETRRLIAVIRRGGVITWSAAALFTLLQSVVSVYRKDSGSETQQIFFPILVMLCSIGGCRLILQLRKSNFAPSVPASQQNGNGEVPPNFELSTYDSAWDARTLVEQLSESIQESSTS